MHLTSPEQLMAVCTAELEGLRLCIGRELRLRLAMAPGCRLRRIHKPMDPNADGWIRLGLLQAGARPTLAIQLEVAPEVEAMDLCDLLQAQAQWLDGNGVPRNVAGVLLLPLVSGEQWQALPVDEEVQLEVLSQKAAQQPRTPMHGIVSGAIEATCSSVQAPLFSHAYAKSSPDLEQERQVLNELLDLIATSKLSLARKVMNTQAFTRTSGRKPGDREVCGNG